MSGICGIASFLDTKIDSDLVQNMAQASQFRAPDGIRYWFAEHIGFAHLAKRISPESFFEQQPLVNDQHGLVLTADARIDARDELLTLLLSRDLLRDKNATDSELILAAYIAWGVSCVDKLCGDFAFAIWDQSKQQLFCARDVVGARQFCCYYDGQTFRFASDSRQILVDRIISRDLDGHFLADFLTYNFRFQALTIFKEIKNLLPGHCLVVNRSGLRNWRYWNPESRAPILYKDKHEYTEHFRELLQSAVRDRLRTNKKPVGILVSGGLDSSSIAAIAQDFHVHSGAIKPIAYNEVFSTLKECDESHFSRILAQETGLEMHRIDTENFTLFDNIDAFTPDLESPMMGYESLTRHVFELASSHGCDVMMTGFGGDSLFDAAKFQYFDDARTGRWWRLRPWFKNSFARGGSWPGCLLLYLITPLLPARVRQLVDKWRGSGQYWHVPSWIHSHLHEHINLSKRLRNQRYAKKYHNSVRQMQYEHIIGLAQQGRVIDWFDRRAAMYGLVPTYPLLDRRIAEFVLASPLELGAQPGPQNTKWIMREALKDILPEQLRMRQGKTGWNAYVTHQFKHNHTKTMAELAQTKHLSRYQLIASNAFQQAMQAFLAEPNKHPSPIVFFFPLLLEQWLSHHTNCNIQIDFDTMQYCQTE